MDHEDLARVLRRLNRSAADTLHIYVDVGVQVQAELVDQVEPHERPPES